MLSRIVLERSYVFFFSPLFQFTLPVEFNYLEDYVTGESMWLSSGTWKCVCRHSGWLLEEVVLRCCVCCSTDMIRLCCSFSLGGSRPDCIELEVGECFDKGPVGGHRSVFTVGFDQILNVHSVTWVKFCFVPPTRQRCRCVMA